ncbi:acyl carrier protein [Streptomyces sp. YS415]|uniref:acyl carrier protein n=1 Tax=Streptomyces sp. YS415 TaxID=2944806 RepID=UPI00201FF2F1|nr:acyl carrier protein [Streptomyces sp. YS415]MCL7428971.1 acyl carrier protein [Streptomyces sp. YS415]
MPTVARKLADILTHTLGVEPEELRPDVTMAALELDSLALAELGAAVHDQFGVKVAGEQVGKASTFAEVVAAVEGQMAAVAGGN